MAAGEGMMIHNNLLEAETIEYRNVGCIKSRPIMTV